MKTLQDLQTDRLLNGHHIAVGKLVKSLRTERLQGRIVGHGVMQWPATAELNGDDEPHLVYLVQVAVGSSSLGPACVVMRSDQVEEVI